MATPAVTLRTALVSEAITGLGLDAAQTLTLREARDDAATLARAIREALERAREQGLSAFAPDSATLQVPGSVTSQERRDLFGKVIGQPFQAGDESVYPGLPGYGVLSLAQWSAAEDALALYMAREDSKLTPGAGGGPQYARGRWFVNGEPYTMAELFLTVRMGNLGALDGELAKDLNTLSTNTNLARDLMEVLADMKRRRVYREAELQDPAPSPAYNAASQYIVEDRVSYNGKTYRATGVNSSGTYSATALYSVGDHVYYQGKYYEMISAKQSDQYGQWTVGESPSNASYWKPVAAYSDTTKYDKGDYVLYNGQYYEMTKYYHKPFFGDNYTQGIEPTNREYWSAPLMPDQGNSFLSGVAPTDTQYWALVEAQPNPSPSYQSSTDFAAFIVAAGRTVSEVMDLGTRFKGANSALNRLGAAASSTPPAQVSSRDYADAMTELQALFDSINAQNDVKKLRVDALHNARTSVLEGMSALLSSDVQQAKNVGRNL